MTFSRPCLILHRFNPLISVSHFTPCPTQFCNHKTSAPTFDGGGRLCSRCPAGSDSRRHSRTQIITQSIVFAVVCLLVIIKVIKRKAGFDNEKLAAALHLEEGHRSLRSRRRTQAVTVTREQARYARLRPNLEVIAGRLGSIDDAGSGLAQRRTVLHVDKAGNIAFHANDFFDVLDRDGDGEMSYEEINEVLGLSDAQLQAFVANMAGRAAAGSRPTQRDRVSRSTFVRFFLDALADASQLKPTAQEAAELFEEIAQGGRITYDDLYGSALSSFLSDEQIYGLISRFKQQPSAGNLRSNRSSSWAGGWIGGEEEGISKREFVDCYPRFLGEVSRPDFAASARDLGSNENNNLGRGLDVAFENLRLAVTVRNKQVNVVDGVTGRLRSNTMTAVMGGSGSGKSSLLNALCGRAYCKYPPMSLVLLWVVDLEPT